MPVDRRVSCRRLECCMASCVAQVLQVMSEQLNSLPTLSEKSGVPEMKLREVYQWFKEAAKASVASQRQADERVSPVPPTSEPTPSPSDAPLDAVEASIYQGFLPLPSQLMAALNPTYFLDALFHDASSMPLDFGNGGQVAAGDEGQRHVVEACGSSATANFLVSDKRLGMTLLSTASVTVAAGVEGTSEELGVEEAQRTASDCAQRLAKKRVSVMLECMVSSYNPPTVM